MLRCSSKWSLSWQFFSNLTTHGSDSKMRYVCVDAKCLCHYKVALSEYCEAGCILYIFGFSIGASSQKILKRSRFIQDTLHTYLCLERVLTELSANQQVNSIGMISMIDI